MFSRASSWFIPIYYTPATHQHHLPSALKGWFSFPQSTLCGNSSAQSSFWLYFWLFLFSWLERTASVLCSSPTLWRDPARLAQPALNSLLTPFVNCEFSLPSHSKDLHLIQSCASLPLGFSPCLEFATKMHKWCERNTNFSPPSPLIQVILNYESTIYDLY